MEAPDLDAPGSSGDLAPQGVEALAEYHRLLSELKGDFQNASRHLEIGRFHLRLGHRQRAYSAFRAAKALEPGLEPAYLFLGRMYREDGDLEKARATYLQLLERKSDSAAAHLELGKVYRAQGDLARAVASLGRGAQLDPQSVEAYRLLAEMALSAGEPERALGYLNHLKALTPRDPRIFVLAARAQLSRGTADRAVLDLRHAIGLDREDPAPRLDLARLYLEEGLPQKSLEALQPVLAGEKPVPEAVLLAARCHEAAGAEDLAEAELVRLARLTPEDPAPFLERARLRVRRDDPAGAEPWFREAEARRPGDPTPLLELASVYEAKDRCEDARRVLDDLSTRHPAASEVQGQRARVVARLGDLERALGILDAQLGLEPSAASLYRIRARIRLEQGRYEEALHDLEDARRIDPEGWSESEEAELLQGHHDYRQAYQLHGEAVAALARGDFPAAHGHLREIVRLVPGNARWLADLADTARVIGEFDEALARFRDLMVLDTKDTSARRAHADLAYRLDRYEEAARDYETLVEIEPGDLRARIRVLRCLRHRLVDRQVGADLFPSLEEAYRSHLESGDSDLARVELAYLHLGMGSHLFEPKVWVSAVDSHLAGMSEHPSETLLLQAALARLEKCRLADDPAGIEAALEAWMAVAPDDPDACAVHAGWLEATGRLRDGRTAAERAARRFPEDGRLHLLEFRLLAAEARNVPDGDRALRSTLRELQQEAAADPNSGPRYLRLGFAHLALADADRRLEALGLASAAFRKSADLLPENPWPWWGGVRAAGEGIQVARGSHAAWERGLAAARAAVRRFPREAWLLYELGMLATEDPDSTVVREGMRALERCLTSGPRPFAPAHARLGELADRRGDRQAAYHHYLKVFEEPEGLLEDRRVLGRLRTLVPA